MDISELVNLCINSGVSIVIITYFILRDWKFNNTLVTTLTSLVNAIDTLKQLISEKEGVEH